MTHTVIRQSWTEYERGWGQKPWGHSLHLTKEDMARANSAYWATMPDAVQDWYIAPDREAQAIEVSEELYQEIAAQKDAPEERNFNGYGLWHDGRTKVVLVE